MTDLADFLPLLNEDVDTIRARVDADVNMGYAPEDAAFIDTIVGGFYYDLTQALILEIERLWDFLSIEVPGAAFVTTAWDTYLDEHGAVIGVPRHDAVQASGTVTFTGTNGTVIPQGFTVARPAADADDFPVEFTTLEAVTVASGTAEVEVIASETGSRGNVAAGTITVMVTPLSGLASVTNATATTSGADIEGDEAYRDRLLSEYSARQGAGSQNDYERWALAVPQVGAATVVPLWAGAGTVRVVVTDQESNPVSTVVRDELQNILDPSPAITALEGSGSPVTMPGSGGSATITVTTSTTGFTDAGYIWIGDDGDYDRIRYTAKTGTTFTGCTGGSGTQPDNASINQRGTGGGTATIGHEVIVDTPTVAAVDVTATVDLEDGFTLDGTAGTTAVRESIEAAIRAYIDALKPGEDVLINRVESRIINVRGVYNVGTAGTPVTLNAGSTDLAIPDEQVALTDTITLSV